MLINTDDYLCYNDAKKYLDIGAYKLKYYQSRGRITPMKNPWAARESLYLKSDLEIIRGLIDKKVRIYTDEELKNITEQIQQHETREKLVRQGLGKAKS